MYSSDSGCVQCYFSYPRNEVIMSTIHMYFYLCIVYKCLLFVMADQVQLFSHFDSMVESTPVMTVISNPEHEYFMDQKTTKHMQYIK